MDKPDPRRKITFYLNPESNAAERHVCEEIEKMPQGERGNVWRATLLSGFALRKQDERLPHLLAAQLTDSTTFDEMVLLMQSVFPEEMKALNGRRPASRNGPEGASAEQESSSDTDSDTDNETRRNAQNMFGGG